MGNEDPPHVAMVSVHFISLHAPFAYSGCAKGLEQHQLDADHPTHGITQYILIDPAGPPEQYAPAVPVRLVSQPHSLPFAHVLLRR